MAVEETEGRHVKIWIEDQHDEINSLTLALMLKEKQYEDLEFLAHLDFYASECTDKNDDGGERIDSIKDCLSKYKIVMDEDGEIKHVPAGLVVVDIGDEWEHHTLIFREKKDL